MKIAVDLDDVLVQFNKGFLDYHNKKYGTTFDLIADRPYRYDEYLGVDLEEAVKRVLSFYESKEFIALEPMEFSQEVVSRLNNEHELIIITSRPSKMKDLTLDWLDNHFRNNFEKVVLTGQFGLKKYKK